MKTSTALTAVALLIAGMSFASAQTSPSNTMDKSAASSKTAPNVAEANGKFCSHTAAGSVINCTYASLAACKKAVTSNDVTCAPNAKLGTTGSK